MADVNMKTDSAGAQGQPANGAGASGGPQNAQSTPLDVSIKTIGAVNVHSDRSKISVCKVSLNPVIHTLFS